MSESKKKQSDAPDDGRGARPTDPNELAAWIVEQSTTDNGHPKSTKEADGKPSVQPKGR